MDEKRNITYEGASINDVRDIALIVGWLILKAGGSVTVPPLSELSAILEGHFALDQTRNPDMSATLTLISMSSLQNKEKGVVDARAN